MESMQKLFESVEACAERLDQLNKQYAHLATESTHESVESWKRVREHILLENAQARAAVATVKVQATELLEKAGHSLEEVIDILKVEQGVSVDIPGLVKAVGKAAYITALRREAVELQANSISFSQVARLWNDLNRPALGGESWTARTVSILVE